ncbi:MAG: 2-oxoacid:acceptor oxidoreductase family protein [Oscillospiraceae bacterium]|nr:2-oxoacid:acceptor oxidoreductase family protein [Oscillospiraceae bacterium]
MQKIKFYGVGGQGAVTAAKVLSIAVCLYQDEYAVTVPVYSHERRGSPVYAHIIVDDQPVLLNCYVYEPDIVVVFDDDLIDMGVDVAEGCSPDTVLVLNTRRPETAERYRRAGGFRRILTCDATGAAVKTIGLNIPNSAMLGALARTGVVSIDAVGSALRDAFGKAGEKNVNAAEYAYEHTQDA